MLDTWKSWWSILPQFSLVSLLSNLTLVSWIKKERHKKEYDVSFDVNKENMFPFSCFMYSSVQKGPVKWCKISVCSCVYSCLVAGIKSAYSHILLAWLKTTTG